MFRKPNKKTQNQDLKDQKIPKKLEQTRQLIKKLFHVPTNADIVIRDLNIGSTPAFLLFISSISNTKSIEDSIIKPLLSINSVDKSMGNIIDSASITEVETIHDAIQNVNRGNTVVFIDGSTIAYKLDTTKFEARSIEKPANEITLTGPKEGFNETASTNINLIRKRVQNENLVFENVTISARGNNQLFISYISDIANTETIDKIRKKIKNLDPALLQNLSILEEYIDEHPYSLFPTLLHTERPDRAAAFLNDGHVILLMEGTPAVLVLPATFWSFIHSPDDQYLRFIFGNFIRILRAISIFVTIFTSAIYVAVTNFHSSMIPPDLLFAIASTREKVPFPALVEVLIMELAFELIREAGLRVPAPIGPTIGIVGALILGQSAVQANIVSPIVVIVVALSGLSSFVVGDISMNFAIRSTRLLFILAAGLFGIFGMAAVFAVGMFYMVSIRSFGVPYLAPFTPVYASSKNVLFRRRITKEKYRPEYLDPKDLTKK
ncbi:spore germination protein [Aciduricibacillus chroicocephali]|uniref:Spore germination protein n=1 Tax=Aciduricibacillus chroicocephali TaxID=3054939 RepID=A0ABY9KY93_9BACI|nr:spore germination protein [Bacillaceae bacterium 44XB]